MQNLELASRLQGFDLETIWTVIGDLARSTQSISLGQGYPSWQPPKFFQESLKNSAQNCNHQYTRCFGSLSFAKILAKYYEKQFPSLNPETNVLVTNGCGQAIHCALLAFVNKEEEVIVFDPAFDFYRPQTQMAGGKTVSIPLRPKRKQTKKEISKRCCQKIFSSQDDDWQIDFTKLQASLSTKTKAIIINSPHNPTGKVFSQTQLNKIAKMLQKYPQIISIQDNVYEGITFDELFGKSLPKISLIESMKNRSLNVYTAGKMMSATGVRIGWIIGNQNLIRYVRSVHQYNVFCSYNFVENTVANSLQSIMEPKNNYLQEQAQKLMQNRNILIAELLKSRYDFYLWVPKGGYFILADISNIEVPQKYRKDEKGNKLGKDFAFIRQMATESGVICIPCSNFYDKDDQDEREKYVRFAYCKDRELLLQAGKKLR